MVGTFVIPGSLWVPFDFAWDVVLDLSGLDRARVVVNGQDTFVNLPAVLTAALEQDLSF